MSLERAVTETTRRTVRNGEIFRMGRITAVVAGTPTLYEIDGGRELPAISIGITLAVGDNVAYADQSDGFIFGKLAGT